MTSMRYYAQFVNRYRATYKEEVLGVEPTGDTVTVTGVSGRRVEYTENPTLGIIKEVKKKRPLL